MTAYLWVMVVLCLSDIVFRAYKLTYLPWTDRQEATVHAITMVLDTIMLCWTCALLYATYTAHGG